MRIAAMIARYLMGLGFVIFGMNGFLHFLPEPPMAPSLALDYVKVMSDSHYMLPVFVFQLIGGILLLINRFVPLALTILAPILMNILIFHITMQPAGLPLALIFVMFWFLLFFTVKSAFAGILESRTAA
jgi:hypothetical protein